MSAPPTLAGFVECPEGDETVGLFKLGQRVQLMGEGPVMYVTSEIWINRGMKNEIGCVWLGPAGQHNGRFDHRLLKAVA